MEAATAGKALITTADSGGVLGLVRDKDTGLVAEPDAASLGKAMSTLWQDRSLANAYGLAAREHWISLGVSWSATIEALLQ
jgi:glycosyltransferase involved in cell wall biosynthesis